MDSSGDWVSSDSLADDITIVSQQAQAQALPELVGTLIADRYRVIDLLGVGGMGRVYLAEHIALHKKFALKVLGPNFLDNPVFVERFLQEARAASAVSHRNIVEITDFGLTPDDVPFFAMEYLEGEELSTKLRREGPLAWAEVRALMLQLLAALDAAHARGVIHRDVKPHNCFLVRSSEGQDLLKVLDFGIAKVLTDDVDYKTLTPMGAMIGTVHYMSPQQARSEPIDERADVYAAGVIAFELLTGRTPFQARGLMGVISKLLTEDVPRFAEIDPDLEVPPRVEGVIRKAMAKELDDRYASAADFAAVLEAIPAERAAVPVKRRRVWPRVAAGLGLLALLGVATASLGPIRGDNPDPPPKKATLDPALAQATAEAPYAPRAASVGPTREVGPPRAPLTATEPTATSARAPQASDAASASPPSEVEAPPASSPSSGKRDREPKPSAAEADPILDEPPAPEPALAYEVMIDVRKRCELEIDGRGVPCKNGQLLRLTPGKHQLRWRFSAPEPGDWLSRTLTIESGPRRCLLLFADAYQLASRSCSGAGG